MGGVLHGPSRVLETPQPDSHRSVSAGPAEVVDRGPAEGSTVGARPAALLPTNVPASYPSCVPAVKEVCCGPITPTEVELCVCVRPLTPDTSPTAASETIRAVRWYFAPTLCVPRKIGVPTPVSSGSLTPAGVVARGPSPVVRRLRPSPVGRRSVLQTLHQKCFGGSPRGAVDREENPGPSVSSVGQRFRQGVDGRRSLGRRHSHLLGPAGLVWGARHHWTYRCPGPWTIVVSWGGPSQETGGCLSSFPVGCRSRGESLGYRGGRPHRTLRCGWVVRDPGGRETVLRQRTTGRPQAPVDSTPVGEVGLAETRV